MDLVTLGVVIALCYWARRLARRPRAPRLLFYLPYLIVFGWAVCTFGTVYMLIHSFDSVAGVDPSEKATRLARGISEAMNCVAFELLVIVAAAAVLLFFRFRLPRPPADQG